MDQAETLREWARLFNEGLYYEAHEVVEERWHRVEEPERTFLKGLIHASVALCHYQRANGHGARVKYASAIRYLAPYCPEYAGVQVNGLIRALDLFFEALTALPRGSAPPAPAAEWPTARLALE